MHGHLLHMGIAVAFAISLDLRRRVLADCQAGHTFAAVARKYTVSAEWVRLFYRRFEQTGEVAARSHATRRPPFHARHEAALRAAVAEQPDRMNFPRDREQWESVVDANVFEGITDGE